MPEQVKSTPRVKAVPMVSNPELLIGVGEKGGISIYGLQRFPVTLFWEQWATLLDEEVVAEIAGYAEANRAQLSDGKPKVDKVTGKPELMTVTPELAGLLDAEIAKLRAANDFDGHQKYATIKGLAVRQGGKLGVDDLMELYQLKARK